MADVDAPLVEQVFDVAERHGQPDAHHHGQADDFGSGIEVAKGTALGHPQKARRPTQATQDQSLSQCRHDA